MGITIFKMFIWGGILPELRSEIMFYGFLLMRQYTSPNENFECSCPLIQASFCSQADWLESCLVRNLDDSVFIVLVNSVNVLKFEYFFCSQRKCC